MFKLLENGELLNLDWVDTFEVVDNTIVYTMVNGQQIVEEYDTPEHAQESAEDIGKEPEKYEIVNEEEF